MLSEHLTLTEATRYLGISRAKMSRMVKEGLIPYHRSALDLRVKLFSVGDLDEVRAGPHRAHRPQRSLGPRRHATESRTT